MTFRYTDLSDEELGACLAKIRRIANMSDTDALSEVDELINVLRLRGGDIGSTDNEEDLFDGYDSAADELNRFEKDIKRSRRLLERGDADIWVARSLLVRAEELGEDWDSGQEKRLGVDLARLIDEATELTRKVEAKWAENRIQESKNDIIHSVSSIGKIRREMAEAREALERVDGMTPEIENMIRASLERCAWHRAKKKLSSAAIEKEVGNEKKEMKLLAEARALIREDWRAIFDSDTCPNIDDVPE